MSERYDVLPLARAVLADSEAPPVALLAAWKAVYWGDEAKLRELAYAAAATISEDKEA